MRTFDIPVNEVETYHYEVVAEDEDRAKDIAEALHGHKLNGDAADIVTLKDGESIEESGNDFDWWVDDDMIYEHKDEAAVGEAVQ